MIFIFGMIIGGFIGMAVVSLCSTDSYNRGYKDGKLSE